jgi:uncharacterized damage-inducible protein DinB
VHDGSTASSAGGLLLNAALLRQGAAIARSLPAELFTWTLPLLPGGTLGKHLRHVAEFYDAFLDGVATGRIDYESRRRDVAFESSPEEAARRMETLAFRLESMDGLASDRAIVAWGEGSTRDARSTLGREIDALLSHTIHHYALVAVFLRSFGIEPPEEFGVAPSTLRHWESAAAR